MRYRQSVTDGGSTVQEEYIVPVSDVVWEISPLNAPWVNAGCYAGAIPANESDIGTYSVATWSGWNKDSVYSDMRDMSIRHVKGSSQQNLRFMAKYNSGSFNVSRQYFNWTNLREPTVTAIRDAIPNRYEVSNYAEYDPYRRQNKNVSAFGNSNSPLNVAPLESLQINNLIFAPRFVIKEIEYYNYDDVSGGYQDVLNPSSNVLYSWSDIKPADKTPAGENYDADLFDKGWKEIDPVNEGGRRFRYCCGVYLIPYYGKSSNSYNATTDTYTAGTNPDDGKIYSDRQVFGSVASETDEYPIINTTTNMTRPCLMVMTESYNTVTGGLTYSTPTGIMFPNYVPSGNISGSLLALQPSWSLASNFQTFAATMQWSSQFFTGNQNTSNLYADLDPSTSNTSPDLSIPTKIDFDINISHLYDISELGTSVRHYIPNDNPIAFMYTKSNRNVTATNCAFFSINALWHTIASLGCYVADDFTAAQKAPTGYYTGNNNHLYLGHMDANGITDGIMLQGGDIPASVQSGIDDIIQNTPYTPVTPTPEPSDDGIDDTDKGTGTNLPAFGLKLAGSGGFMSYFLLGMSGLTALATALSTTAQSFWAALGTATDFRTSNLLQYISSLKWYPIDILAGNQGLYADVDTTDITFGFDSNAKLPLGTSIKKLGTTIRVYNMGAVQIPYKLGYETFLDKDPYSTVQVWLPFCGMYPVKSDFVVGNTVSFYYVIDLVTGMCTALVTNGQQTLLNVSGKIGVDYAVTGNDIITQSERMAGAYVNSALSAIAGGINLGTSIASENAIGAVTASAGFLGDIAKSSIDIASAKRAVPVAVSAGSGFGSSFAPNTPCVIVNPPAIRLPEDYGHAQGYVYNQTVSIGAVSGFTVCDNPDLSGIPATSTELDMIRSILTSGFYA